MLTALVRRVALSCLILFLVAVFVFAATEILPGDALDSYLSSDDLSVMSEDDIETMRERLGLDRPAWERFWDWFSGVLVGDFGKTVIDGQDIMDVIWQPLLNSLLLGTVITAITLPVAFAIGIITGYNRGNRADTIVSTTAIIGYSIPDFVIGSILIILFAVWLPLFPAVILVFSNAPAAVNKAHKMRLLKPDSDI